MSSVSVGLSLGSQLTHNRDAAPLRSGGPTLFMSRESFDMSKDHWRCAGMLHLGTIFSRFHWNSYLRRVWLGRSSYLFIIAGSFHKWLHRRLFRHFAARVCLRFFLILVDWYYHVGILYVRHARRVSSLRVAALAAARKESDLFDYKRIYPHK